MVWTWEVFVGGADPRIFHFTHVHSLTALAECGQVLSDCALRARGSTFTETGEPGIKEQRRRRRVPVPPGGVVGDYVPFCFAPRSPMAPRGGAPTVQAG